MYDTYNIYIYMCVCVYVSYIERHRKLGCIKNEA